MRFFVRLLQAFVFFTLFAFALNNQQEAAVRWFFGFEWRAPMVIVVLAAFAAGCAFGVLAMVPTWWRHRRAARLAEPAPTVQPSTFDTQAAQTTAASDFAGLEHPPREGL
jgi:lipopolysaccharide assembly protein A